MVNAEPYNHKLLKTKKERKAQTSTFNSSSIVQLEFSEQDIRLMNALNLNDILFFCPNFNSVYLGIEGTTLNFASTGRKTVLVLLDGVPIWNSSLDKVDMNYIYLQNIEKITISYGAGPILHGSNAIGAIIRLTTKKNSLKTFEFAANLTSDIYFNHNISLIGRYNIGRHHFSLLGGRHFFGGYQGIDSGRVNQWVPELKYYSEISYRYDIVKDVYFYSKLFLSTSEKRAKGAIIPSTIRAKDLTQNSNLTHGDIGVIGRFSRIHFIEFHNTFSRFNLTNRRIIRDLHTLEAEEIVTTIPGDRLRYEQYISSLTLQKQDTSSIFNYLTGMKLMHQRDLESKFIDNIKPTITQFSFHGSTLIHPWDKWLFKFGSRYTSSNRFKTPLAYRIGSQLRMSSTTQIFIDYTKSYRIPAFNELFYTFTDQNLALEGNLNLKSETYKRLQFTMKIKHKKFHFQSHLYWQNSTNTIQLQLIDRQQAIYSYINTGSIKSFGQLISIDHQNQVLRSRITLSNNGINQLPDSLTSYYFYQQATIWLQPNIKIWGLLLNVQYNYSGAISNVLKVANGELQDFKQADYSILDLSLSKSMLKGKLQLGLGVKNIFNVQNLSGLFLPLERLDDSEIISSTNISITLPRRVWFSIHFTI